MGKKGYLILENGQIFEGESIGCEKAVSGEVVFNTGMTGYPESFTDPSFFGQILVETYPLIGNYGVPLEKSVDGLPLFYESDSVHIRGLVVSSYVENTTHWNAIGPLSQFLKSHSVAGLSGVDTRSLTQMIREKGVMKGILTFETSPHASGCKFTDINAENLVAMVSCKKPVIYGSGKTRILFFDCGVKLNQIRLLLQHDTTVIRVPWDYDPFRYQSGSKGQDIQGLTPFDVIMISNGPGDPKMAEKTISVVREALKRRIPVLGVCLGNQILALAAGADTYKLTYGHRGQNQPVRDTRTGRCYITTQNHGFAVDTKTIPKGWTAWFTNLNDGTNEGLCHKTLPFFSTQFHPEDTPGPTDTRWIFDYFLEESSKWIKKTAR